MFHVGSAALAGRPGQSWTESYTAYDGVNRLTAASETGGWNHTYVYDNFGNRAVTAGVINAYATPTALTQYTNNRWLGNGVSYDAAGDQTALPSRTFTYDAENRLVASTQPSTAAISYSYDGDGRRVMKTIATTPTPTVTTYVYDAMGQLAAEYGTATDSGTSYLTSDHLGSTRVVTDATGTIKKCYDYYPFGEDIAAGTGGRSSCFANGVYPSNPDTLAEKFTSKKRDAETGLDYFGARYFSGPQGRFTSADPTLSTAHLDNPQSWNRYAYVNNNPLRLIDQDGRQALDANVQKMLQLLRAPITKTAGVAKGGLIQYFGQHGVNFVLGEIFGYTPNAVKGGLSMDEYR